MLGDLLSDLRYRLRAIVRRRNAELELEEELRFHMDTEAERLVRGGMPPDVAHRHARLAFGAVEDVKESTRDARGVRFVEHLARDLSQAMRVAVKQPGFTVIVVLSLALGIGATTAVFNVAWSVLFAPLAVPHPEQLITLWRHERDNTDILFTWNEFRALRETGAGSFVTSRAASSVSVIAGERRQFVTVHFVDGDYLRLAGVRPIQGRLITAEDDAQRAPVMVLGEWFASQLFPGESSIVGRTVSVRGATFTVIGVLPRSFRGLEWPGFFRGAIPESAVPLLGSAGPGRDNRGVPYGVGDPRLSDERTFRVVGRMVTERETARSALSLAFQRCCRSSPDEWLEVIDIRLGIPGGKNDFRVQARTIMTLLLGGMALVLVVVCCNIASLLLVRASARQREVAVRLALGASRGRLVSQLVLESMPNAVLGGLGGLIFATWYTAYFIRNLPMDMADSIDAGAILGVHIGPAFAFTAVLTLLCGVAFAVYPALRITKQQLAHTLRLDVRSSRPRSQGVVARGVVLAQVAVTVVLVSAASLFAVTLGNLVKADGGYATEKVLLATLEARSTRYEQTGLAPRRDEILRKVREIPGVKAATVSTLVPLFGGTNRGVGIKVPGYRLPDGSNPTVRMISVVPGYFETTEIRLLSGRDFSLSDRAPAEPVAIVSSAFARHYFAGSDALGRSIGVFTGNERPTNVRIVGIANDARYYGLRDQPEPFLYLPMSQTAGVLDVVTLLVRTSGEPLSLAPALSRAIDAAAPGVSVRRVRDMRTERDQAITLERLVARLAIFVSSMALLLSAVGLYGVVAYGVARRTSEIGVRIALGATRHAVLWLVARETVLLVGVGVLIGIPLSFAASGALRSQLFGVGAYDPRATAMSVLLLAAVAVLASVIPARRAARIDPRIALNAE